MPGPTRNSFTILRGGEGNDDSPPVDEVVGDTGVVAAVSTITNPGMLSMINGTRAQRKSDIRGVQMTAFASKLWSKKKFVHSKEELDFKPDDRNSLCVHCLTHLMYDVHSNRVFWDEYKHLIVQTFNHKRTSVAYGMKKEWLSKLLLELCHCMLLISIG